MNASAGATRSASRLGFTLDMLANAKSSLSAVGTLDFLSAAARLKGVAVKTPLQLNLNLSKRYDCEVYLKREDLQVVRSYKLRGAYNMMATLSPEVLARGVVCASAGNHAQGFALSCRKMGAKGIVFMPTPTPKQKVRQTHYWGEDSIEVRLIGDTFDDTAAAAQAHVAEHGGTFIPPFDHIKIIEGQVRPFCWLQLRRRQRIDTIAASTDCCTVQCAPSLGKSNG